MNRIFRYSKNDFPVRLPFRTTDNPVEREYRNIAKQILEGKSTIRYHDISSALIFLETRAERFCPALMEPEGDEYLIIPLRAFHAVRGEVTGDTFKDLKGILKDGFKTTSNYGLPTNAYAAGYDPFVCPVHGPDIVYFARKSYEEDTFGDAYCLSINEFCTNAAEPRSISDRHRKHFLTPQVISISYADPQDIDVTIVLNGELSDSDAMQRKDFYKKELRNTRMRFMKNNMFF